MQRPKLTTRTRACKQGYVLQLLHACLYPSPVFIHMIIFRLLLMGFLVFFILLPFDFKFSISSILSTKSSTASHPLPVSLIDIISSCHELQYLNAPLVLLNLVPYAAHLYILSQVQQKGLQLGNSFIQTIHICRTHTIKIIKIIYMSTCYSYKTNLRQFTYNISKKKYFTV